MIERARKPNPLADVSNDVTANPGTERSYVFGKPGPNRWKRWLWYLLLWMIPVMVISIQRNAMYRNWKLPVSFFEEFSLQIFFWYLYALLGLYVAHFLHRFPIRKDAPIRSVAPHVAGMLAFIGLRSVIMAFYITWVIGGYWEKPRTFEVVIGIYTLKYLTIDAAMYWLIVGFAQLRATLTRHRAQELKTSQLETQLAMAQLSALKMQLHPHFLFNTLNAIAALVRTDNNKGAVKMIVGLSELLRMAIDSPKTHIVTLEQELSFLDRYLAIEQVRFPDRLRVQKQIDPQMMDALVPNLILQPLVENAICHGLAPRSEPGLITIGAEQRPDGKLILQVCDDGPGLPEGWTLDTSNGVGLSNTRARLKQLYGPDQSFEMTNQPAGGTCGKMTIPTRFAADETATDAAQSSTVDTTLEGGP